MVTTFYKTLDGLSAHHGGTGKYPGVGRWTRHLNPDKLEPCEYGYHLAKDKQILAWLGPTIYEAEPCDVHPPVDAGDKWVTCRVRLTRKLDWNDRTARLFAADVAETVVHLTGPDERCEQAIATARRYANGQATKEELAAAGAAAWAAAEYAAKDTQYELFQAHIGATR